VHNLLRAIGADMILYYSFHQESVSLVPNIPIDKDDPCVEKEKSLSASQFQIYQGMPNTILYTGSSRIKHFFDMARRACSCTFYSDRAICHHFMFAAKQYKLTLGKQSTPSTNFVKLKSAGRRKKNGKWHERD
jgi:hypothetical protein